MQRLMKRWLLFLCFVLSTPISAGVLLSSLIDDVIDQDLSTSNFSIVVKDPDTEEIICQHQAHKYLSPASNTKLFPAIAGLLTLGPAYQYKTEVAYNPAHLRNNVLTGNLYIKFNGDPTLTDKQLGKLLAETGIRQINGSIYIDSSRYSPPEIPLGTSYDDMGWYYAARSSAIIINENAFKVVFRSGHFKKSKMIIKPVDKTYGIKIKSEAETLPDAVAHTHCDLFVRPQAKDQITVYGCWPQSKKERPERLAVPDPFYWAEQIIRAKLKDNHMHFFGRIHEGPIQNNVKVMHVHYSWRLKNILKHMLYESDNIYADSLAKTIAAEQKKVGTFKAASFAMKQILKKYLMVNVDDMNISDGAGTRYNLMTTLQIAEVLSAAYRKPDIRQHLMHAMPLSGVRGSLRARMNDPQLKGRVFAKTGSMHDISSLAGYITLPNKKTLVFAMITNNFNGKLEHLKKIEDRLVETIWSSES